MPQLGLVNLLICEAHFEPFSIAWLCCIFHVRCWSTIRPKYLTESVGVNVPPATVNGGLSVCFVLCAKSISASYLI